MFGARYKSVSDSERKEQHGTAATRYSRAAERMVIIRTWYLTGITAPKYIIVWVASYLGTRNRNGRDDNNGKSRSTYNIPGTRHIIRKTKRYAIGIVERYGLRPAMCARVCVCVRVDLPLCAAESQEGMKDSAACAVKRVEKLYSAFETSSYNYCTAVVIARKPTGCINSISDSRHYGGL